MKKIINIIILLFMIILMSSCFWSDDKVNQAKKELWIIEVDNADETDENDSWSNVDLQESTWSIDLSWKIEEVKKNDIISLTDEQFLELDDLSGIDLSKWELEIKWKTLSNVDKIIVTFENKDSEFPVDKFVLKQFKAWDVAFVYRAFSRYETFDYWKNVYTFEAYSWDKVSKLQLVVNYEKQDEKNVSEKIQNISEKISLNTLPSNSIYWNPIDLWNWSVSYSDLKWLEINKKDYSDLTCDNLSASLVDKISSYYYWNTCRSIKDKQGVSFFVIRLDWDKYVYEKHYYITSEWINWVQELEKWIWVDLNNIKDKNQELKGKNLDYPILKVTDELFKEMIK